MLERTIILDPMDILKEDNEKLKEENKILRELILFSHGCDSNAIYGDDGEKQCRQCGIDFKRISAVEIQNKRIKKNMLILKGWYSK